MIVFCLTVHHLWGRTLNKHHQDACAVAYADDGYIKAKLSVALEVLSDIKHVLKEDAGLSLNFDSTQNSKTKFLVKHDGPRRSLLQLPPLAACAPPRLRRCSCLRSLPVRRHASAAAAASARCLCAVFCDLRSARCQSLPRSSPSSALSCVFCG